jgi:hypothetical protein
VSGPGAAGRAFVITQSLFGIGYFGAAENPPKAETI